MHVYALWRCEEYWMQESKGLFASKESAVAAVGKTLLEKDMNDSFTVLITREEDHYSNSPSDKIIARGGVEVTDANVRDYLNGFEFYDLEHAGYGVWGIYKTEVLP